MEEEQAGTTQHAFRFPASLVARLDRHVERMQRRTRGVTFTRADAVRSLLCDRLDDVERYEREERECEDDSGKGSGKVDGRGRGPEETRKTRKVR